jgi:hypothetical protein
MNLKLDKQKIMLYFNEVNGLTGLNKKEIYKHNGGIMKKLLVSLMLVLGLVAFAAESAPSATVGYVKYPCVTTATSNLNFISIPLDAGITAMSGLDASGDFSSASSWNSASQGWETCDNFGGGFWFPDNAVSIGQPLMVNANTAHDFIVDGDLVADPNYNLVTTATSNLNFIQHPLSMASYTTIQGLGDDIGTCSSASEWNAASQGWATSDNFGGGFWFPDFATEIGKPIMVNVTSASVWPGTKGEFVDSEVKPSAPKGTPRNVYLGVVDKDGALFDFATADVTWKTWITGREGEVLQEFSTGANSVTLPFGVSVVITNIGNFATPWSMGDEINFRPKHENGVAKVVYEPIGGDILYTIPDATANTIYIQCEPWQAGTGAPAVLGQVSSIDGNMPLETKLEQNYPNPFNPTTTINFSLKSEGVVKLNVYNYTGQLVNSLVDGQMNAGYHTVNFDASNLSAGVYYYTLEADNKVMTNKMVLVK